MLILGIETSCDETAAAVIKVTPSRNRQHPRFKILSNVVSSQISIHAQYGGVVPELAARAHTEALIPVLKMATEKILGNPPDLIAATYGPGLITSLMIGLEGAKILSWLWEKPLAPINHLSAHIYSNWFETKEKIEFPAVCLVVSGGHTELVLMKDVENFKVIGQTRDDAAGEAFDKAAKILNLDYPGGPAISREAEKWNFQKKSKFNLSLPRPMLNSANFDFSFSGLKTAVLYLVKKLSPNERQKLTPAICAEFQNAVVDVLAKKALAAGRNFKVKTIILSGGVAANAHLRKSLGEQARKNNFKFFLPAKNLCTDNAAMVAAAGYFKMLHSKTDFKNTWKKIKADPNLSFKYLS